MNVEADWQAADLAQPIDVGGARVAIEGETIGDALRLRARFTQGSDGLAPQPEMLARIELVTPGDTRLALDAKGLVATRLLVEPAPGAVRDAAYSLGAALVAAAGGAATRAEQLAAQQVAEADEPVIPDSTVAAQVLDAYRTVHAPQPAWEQPDSALPPAAGLRAGAGYHVVEMQGDWARVRVEDGRILWTDGRALVALGEVEQAPFDIEEDR